MTCDRQPHFILHHADIEQHLVGPLISRWIYEMHVLAFISVGGANRVVQKVILNSSVTLESRLDF